MIEISSDLPSVIFGNLWSSLEMFGNICVTFRQFLENLWKTSESDRKSLENCQKRHYLYHNVYIINKIRIKHGSL